MTDTITDRPFATETGGVAGGQAWELRCPACHGEHLHHEGVRIWERSEDEAMVRLTAVEAGYVHTALEHSAGSENPSLRRHGLAIEFWCEFCAGRGELSFAQHKGVTYLEWRNWAPDAAALHGEAGAPKSLNPETAALMNTLFGRG